MPPSDNRYNATEAEARWQGEWDERKSFLAAEDDARLRYYALEMLPYPSGPIHTSHRHGP